MHYVIASMASDDEEESSRRLIDPNEPDAAPEDHARPGRKTLGRSKWIKIALSAAAVLLLGAIAFAVGLLIGRKLASSAAASTPVPSWGASVEIDGKRVAVVDWLDGFMEADKIKERLRLLSSKPHIGGGDRNKMLTDLIYQQWKEYEFDEVELKEYSVLLSYPNESNPNVLELRDRGGTVLYSARTAQEPPLTPGENDSTVASPFNAYAGVGSASGRLVYVNFARIEDFLYLTNNLSLDLNGSICIARYGKLYRGDKALLAERFGCAGLVMYSDPEQYAPRGGAPVYPNGSSLPEGGVQRGSLLSQEGDPLTPGLPAIEGVYRQSYQDAINSKKAPAIPVQPISYGDAICFMSQLTQHQAPPDWQGQLENLPTYFIAQEESNSNSTYIEVNNIQEERLIYDITATIYGTVDPDHSVLLGNHRDAWVFGAVDPSSATAVLMEIAAALNQLRKSGWRPGRTLVLCNWDAEEPGLIGSTEWVQDKGKFLGASVAAYLNLDIAVSGSQHLYIQSSPLLYNVIFTAANMVKAPNPDFDTVYDEWLHYTNRSYNNTLKPDIGDLGAGTDYSMFLQLQGISCSTMSYSNGTKSAHGYPVYHSVHDNFYWMTNFGDPSFTRHVAMGLVWFKTAILMATTPVLPYEPRDYADALNRILKGLENQYSRVLGEQNITLNYLVEAVGDFTDACIALSDEIKSVTSASHPSSESVVRIINAKLMNIERAFIHDEGLPGRPYFKHVVFTPSSVNTYASSLFPGISDSIFSAVHFGGDWNEVRRQIDVVRVHIRYAVESMIHPTLKYYTG